MNNLISPKWITPEEVNQLNYLATKLMLGLQEVLAVPTTLGTAEVELRGYLRAKQEDFAELAKAKNLPTNKRIRLRPRPHWK